MSTSQKPASFGARVKAGLGWFAVAQIARRLSGLVVTAILARLLAPQDFGLVALATLATQLLATLTELGLTSALVQRQSVDERDLSTAFWLGLSSSLVLAMAGFIAAPSIASIFDEPRIVPLLRVMLVTLPIAALGQIPDIVLQRRLSFRTIAHIDWISALVSGVLGVLAAFAGFGIWALVVQFLASTIITVVLRTILVRWKPHVAFDSQAARSFLAFGMSLVGLGLVNYAIVNIDNALIGARVGTAALGYYMLAYNLVLLPATNVGSLVNRVMFPALSTIQSDRERFIRAYTRMLRTVALATFPLIIGLGATATVAIPLVYGPQWGPTIVLLQILTGIGVFQAVNVSGVAYAALGRPHYLLAWAVVALALMTAGFVIGVRWGVTGVAWSYLIISPIIGLPPHLIANRIIGLSNARFAAITATPLAAAIVMGIVVVALRQPVAALGIPLILQLAILAGTGAIVYALSLLAMAIVSAKGRKPIEWIVAPDAAS